MFRYSIILATCALALASLLSSTTSQVGALEEQKINTTSVSKRLFTYAGPLLPSDWSLVSVLNDRVLIGFNNGSARNSPISELEPRDRNFVERLQNGTVFQTPLASAKEKLSQWSSTVSSTVSKLGKSLKEQYDSLVNSNKNKDPLTNITTSSFTRETVSLGPQ